MALKTQIIGGNNKTLGVNDDLSINTYTIPLPPPNSNQTALPVAEYMKLNGTGTSSFLVDGSIAKKDFYVGAKEYDIYINTIVFEIADAGATLSQFGNLGVLANGFDFYYFNQKTGEYLIDTGLKTNYDFIKLANFEPSFGTGTASFQLTNAISSAEAYVGTIDLEDIFGLQWGLKLTANSIDRIGFVVKDNIVGLDVMTIKIYGIRV
jgi:hypothetical protein